jgi:hypothetical protein
MEAEKIAFHASSQEKKKVKAPHSKRFEAEGSNQSTELILIEIEIDLTEIDRCTPPQKRKEKVTLILCVLLTAHVLFACVPVSSFADKVSYERIKTSDLYAGALLLDAHCSASNAAYMRCKERHGDSDACQAQAAAVSQCTLLFFDRLRGSSCGDRFAAYSKCLYNANNFELAACSKFNAALAQCIDASEPALKQPQQQ